MVRPGSPAPLWGAAGKAGYALSCVAAALVLVISGFSYFVVNQVSSIGGSHAIASGPSLGAQNILLIGLESRTDWEGNILPNDVLKALHACNRQEIEDGCGGNDTNTLILIHIPAGGKKAVGFSIPRDDWVNFADTLGTQQVGKIDQAYGVSMAAKENEVEAQDPGISQQQLAFEGNEAGRAATVATVEALTGVHIDHFAELNLDGFYELTKVLGGVEVCLNHPVPYDPNSGFYAAHAGLQHLDAKMALAFVRQRDGLANGDLDRTHRQQAVLDSVLQQLRADGVLSDLTKVSALLSVAKQYLITDAGWDLLDFITQMRSLTSGNLTFYTLPIVGYQTIDGQDANVVDPAYIQQLVQQTFYGPQHSPAPSPEPTVTVSPSLTTVDVYNGGNTAGLAKQVSAALASAGYTAGKVGNTSPLATTEVLYGAGSAASAAKIAALFDVTAKASPAVAAGHVEVMLGADATLPTVTPAPTLTPTPSTSTAVTSPPTTGPPTTGPQGGAVRAEDGIPCVN
jgi:LCP family protein required for cell wall assembly